jgi:hypothetical protein
MRGAVGTLKTFRRRVISSPRGVGKTRYEATKLANEDFSAKEKFRVADLAGARYVICVLWFVIRLHRARAVAKVFAGLCETKFLDVTAPRHDAAGVGCVLGDCRNLDCTTAGDGSGC